MNIKEKMPVSFGTITITDKAKALISQALDSSYVAQGKLVREFEERFARLHGTAEAVAVATGTHADILPLAVLHDFGARRGDEIIVPALSFVATGNAVLHAGFTPRFVDVRRDTMNIDTAQIAAAVTDKTRAILAVHLMGKPAEMDTISEIAKRHELVVIEDAAEAHGCFYKGQLAGKLGDMAGFSTFVAHIISTIEGGMITTDREDYAEILRSLRSHGRSCTCKRCVMAGGADYCEKRFGKNGDQDIRFTFNRVGYSCKMNELEAAVGVAYMDIYDDVLAKRYANLKYCLDRFERFAPYLLTIKEEAHEKIGPHALPVTVGEEASFNVNDLIRFLGEYKVDFRTNFRSMPTQCPGFSFLGHRLGDYPNAEWLADRGIHIGVHQDLTLEHMEYVMAVLDQFLEKHQN